MTQLYSHKYSNVIVNRVNHLKDFFLLRSQADIGRIVWAIIAQVAIYSALKKYI